MNLRCFRRHWHCRRGSNYNHTDGRIWFWTSETGEKLSRDQSVCHSLHNLSPSTKGQKPQAWYFNQNSLHGKNNPQEEEKIYYRLKEKKEQLNLTVMKQQS